MVFKGNILCVCVRVQTHHRVKSDQRSHFIVDGTTFLTQITFLINWLYIWNACANVYLKCGFNPMYRITGIAVIIGLPVKVEYTHVVHMIYSSDPGVQQAVAFPKRLY